MSLGTAQNSAIQKLSIIIIITSSTYYTSFVNSVSVLRVEVSPSQWVTFIFFVFLSTCIFRHLVQLLCILVDRLILSELSDTML